MNTKLDPAKEALKFSKNLELQNLPFDPAEMAMKESAFLLEEDEIEDDGFRSEALRREKVRKLSQSRRGKN